MNTITFNDVALSDYGLSVVSSELDLISQLVGTVILPTRAYPWEAEREARAIDVKFTVIADTAAQLQTYLDNIKKTLVTTTAKQLKFSIRSDRYYKAVLGRFDGKLIAKALFEGWLRFICADQNAYSTSEDTNSHDITSDPKTIIEAVGGTASVYPVYKLTAGDTLTGITIKLKNDNTGDEIEWTGSLAIGGYLEIDCAHWVIRKNDVVDMATKTGEFPYLEGGVDNSITVTAFGTNGTLLITYRDRYY